jgi:hypothetical protein
MASTSALWGERWVTSKPLPRAPTKSTVRILTQHLSSTQSTFHPLAYHTLHAPNMQDTRYIKYEGQK